VRKRKSPKESRGKSDSGGEFHFSRGKNNQNARKQKPIKEETRDLKKNEQRTSTEREVSKVKIKPRGGVDEAVGLSGLRVVAISGNQVLSNPGKQSLWKNDCRKVVPRKGKGPKNRPRGSAVWGAVKGVE